MATGPGCSERLESSTPETQEGHQHGALVQCRSKCIKLGNMLPSLEINTSSPATPLIVHVVCSVGQSCSTLQDLLDCSSPGFYPWDFSGKNNGMGCHFLLQRIFPTQELNPHLLHCRWILYLLSHSLWNPLPVNSKEILKGAKKHHVKYDL